MIKQLLVFLFVLTLVLGSSLHAQADLFNRGTDSLGNRLIFDDDLNITWYDYTNEGPLYSWGEKWQYQMNWASALAVTFGGTLYDDWRLPTALNQDGTGPCERYNCTGSEMGHLFYTELGNTGLYDTSGNLTGCSDSSPWCLTNKGDFQKLQPFPYWSSMEYADSTHNAWTFSTVSGFQSYGSKDGAYYAIAVRPGDVVVVPEPISSILFIIGGTFLLVKYYFRTA